MVKNTAILKHTELVNLIEASVNEVQTTQYNIIYPEDQRFLQEQDHKKGVIKGLAHLIMPTPLWPAIPSMYNWMFGDDDDDDDEGGLSGEAGEMKLDINLEDDIWDKIWYGAKSVLGWLSLLSAIPTGPTILIGIVCGFLAGAMHMYDDEWGTGVAFWIFEALPYLKVGQKIWARLGGNFLKNSKTNST